MTTFRPAVRPVLAVAVACLALTACQSSRIGALNTQPVIAPLPPQPAGNVQQGTLPPVGSDQFPEAPQVETPAVPDPTAVDAGTGEAPATPTGGAPVTREALVGAWKVSTAGSSCQMFMALTQWTGGFRAASRGCPGDAARIAAWDVSGAQVVLKDSTGDTVARLFSSGGNRYSGSTTGGQAITLSR